MSGYLTLVSPFLIDPLFQQPASHTVSTSNRLPEETPNTLYLVSLTELSLLTPLETTRLRQHGQTNDVEVLQAHAPLDKAYDSGHYFPHVL